MLYFFTKEEDSDIDIMILLDIPDLEIKEYFEMLALCTINA
jgi:hypothetical protein